MSGEMGQTSNSELRLRPRFSRVMGGRPYGCSEETIYNKEDLRR